MALASLDAPAQHCAVQILRPAQRTAHPVHPVQQLRSAHGLANTLTLICLSQVVFHLRYCHVTACHKIPYRATLQEKSACLSQDGHSAAAHLRETLQSLSRPQDGERLGAHRKNCLSSSVTSARTRP